MDVVALLARGYTREQIAAIQARIDETHKKPAPKARSKAKESREGNGDS